MNRRHARTFVGLLNGDQPNGELRELPEPLKSMAEHLAGVGHDAALSGEDLRVALAEARAPLWDAMLVARDDRDKLVLSLADAGLLGPDDNDEEAPAPRVKLTRASDVVCRPIEWVCVWR